MRGVTVMYLNKAQEVRNYAAFGDAADRKAAPRGIRQLRLRFLGKDRHRRQFVLGIPETIVALLADLIGGTADIDQFLGALSVNRGHRQLHVVISSMDVAVEIQAIGGD